MVGNLTLLTYGILRRRQLPGGKAFWPGPIKHGYGWGIDLKFGTNNGMDNTSKHNWLFYFQRYNITKLLLSRREEVIVIRYLSPGIDKNSKRKHFFYPWKHLFWL